ncbi:MAG: glycoside hydrolase family 2 TIM barrel-domain containing protein [Planctomycetia bacterium]|nr:glycoside hydrolase family 2 TIM barrel-domain containing protein [Planctomycetia bacterium]
MKRKTKVLIFLCLFSFWATHSFLLAVEKAPNRNSLNLDGTWSFATDPGQVGESEAWFEVDKELPPMPLEGYAPEANGTIKVPGIWDNQGYGTPNDKVHHNAVGKAWYKRTVSIPKDWNSEESLYFVITGVSRYAKVWINGISVGEEAIGCIGKHEWDVSSLVQPGEEAHIAILVDSKQRWEIDPLLGAASLNDYLEIEWGGIWGHVFLESRPKTRLDSFYLRSDIAQSVCKVETTILNELKKKSCDSLKLEIFDKDRKCVASKTESIQVDDLAAETFDASIAAKIPNAQLWSPDSPYLYQVRLSLMNGDTILDVLESTYGMREIRFDGSKILLNGKRLFLSGYGDDHIYPYEFSMPTDREMYVKRMQLIKQFGFNHVRHHSCVLPHEYYDVCDELGMLPNAEMLLGYPQQLPGEGNLWLSKVPEGTDPEPANETLRKRWAAVIKEYRNHPCIFVWVGGNELSMLGYDRWLKMPLRYQFQEIAHRLDPDRYFCDIDGDWKGEIEKRGERDTLAMNMLLFDEWSNPITNRDKFKTGKLQKPAISHEAGNFITFSRPDQIDLFQCNYKPFWMVDGKAKLEKLGLMDEVEDWACASEKLYLLLHKYNVEGVRLNEELSGYHWWLIQDYWTTSNGLVDLFFRPKSIKPEEVHLFNGHVVLLQKGLKTSYQSGETLDIEALISNFSGKTFAGTLSWAIIEKGNTLPEAEGSFETSDIDEGTLKSIQQVQWTCPDVSEPKHLQLRLVFTNQEDESVYLNYWSTWLYPKEIAPKSEVPIYVEESLVNIFPKNWNVQPLPLDCNDFPSEAVYAVTWATPEILKAVQNGAGLLHFGAQQFLSSLTMQYQQTWWKAGDNEQNNHIGTFVYPNPVTDSMVDESWCDIQWVQLLDGSVKFDLEKAQERPDVFIRALTSLVRVRDAATLFEVGIDKGKMIVSGLNHDNAIDIPVHQWLLAKMIDEVSSDTKAKVFWDASMIVPKVVVPEGMILGIQRLEKFAETGAWHSYRDDNIPNWICRQTGSNELSWKTAMVSKENEADKVTFIFAGALGFATEPKTAGFTMTFNNQDLLQFDLPEDQEPVWKSADEKSELRLNVLREIGPDKFGVFILTVPKELVTKDSSQIIGVRSLGEGSRRWFGLNLYTDFSDFISR